jgi:hypothetical protein
MMTIHLKGGGSTRDTRVSLINVDMVSGLISVDGCGPILWLDEVVLVFYQEAYLRIP